MLNPMHSPKSLHFAGHFKAFDDKLTVVTTGTTEQEDNEVRAVIADAEKKPKFQNAVASAGDGFEIHFKREGNRDFLGCGIKPPGQKSVGWRQDVVATIATIKRELQNLLFDLQFGDY